MLFRSGSTTPVPQEKIDDALEVAADLTQFAKGLFINNQVNVEVGTNPPDFGTEDYIVFFWDNTIFGRGGHGEYLSSNEIYSGVSMVKTTSEIGRAHV